MRTKSEAEKEGDRIFNTIVVSGVLCVLMIKLFL